MAKKPTHRFERSGRARQEPAEKSARLVAKHDRAEHRYKLVTVRKGPDGATP